MFDSVPIGGIALNSPNWMPLKVPIYCYQPVIQAENFKELSARQKRSTLQDAHA
jgi:hypothetical protein